MYREFGVPYSYCIESSFAGGFFSQNGREVGRVFAAKEVRDFGVDIGKSIAVLFGFGTVKDAKSFSPKMLEENAEGIFGKSSMQVMSNANVFGDEDSDVDTSDDEEVMRVVEEKKAKRAHAKKKTTKANISSTSLPVDKRKAAIKSDKDSAASSLPKTLKRFSKAEEIPNPKLDSIRKKATTSQRPVTPSDERYRKGSLIVPKVVQIACQSSRDRYL